MKIEPKWIEISKLINEFKAKLYKVTEFQRKNDVWQTKLKQGLIESILTNVYIPPLLFSSNNVLDGLQRLSAIVGFFDNEFFYFSSGKKCKYDELDDKLKKEFLNHKMLVIDLLMDDDKPLTKEEERELFIKINNNSIKLNTAELQFAKSNYRMRSLIFDIVKNNIKTLQIISRHTKGKRFTYEYLIAWSLTLIYYRDIGSLDSSSHSSIRNLVNNKFLMIDSFDGNKINEIKNTSKKVINVIAEIVGDKISPRAFKVIFSSIFVVFYENVNSSSSFIHNKLKIGNAFIKCFEKIIESQSIGGIHYDSYEFIKERINEVTNVISPYVVDRKRILSNKEKEEIYYRELVKNGGQLRCAICKKIINKWEDLNYDHILAHSKGGETNIINSQITCKKCNLSKSNH